MSKFYNDFYRIAKQRFTKLLEVERENPNKQILLKLKEIIENGLFGCPVQMLEMRREEIKEYPKKAWYYSDYRWYESKIPTKNLRTKFHEWVVKSLNDLIASIK